MEWNGHHIDLSVEYWCDVVSQLEKIGFPMEGGGFGCYLEQIEGGRILYRGHPGRHVHIERVNFVPNEEMAAVADAWSRYGMKEGRT